MPSPTCRMKACARACAAPRPPVRGGCASGGDSGSGSGLIRMCALSKKCAAVTRAVNEVKHGPAILVFTCVLMWPACMCIRLRPPSVYSTSPRGCQQLPLSFVLY